MPGPSVFPLREPSVSGNFCGRIKGVKYRFTLQGGTWDFPGDTGNFGVPLEWDRYVGELWGRIKGAK